MRILVTTDVIGGVWRYTVTLVRALTRRGHSCTVAILGSPDAVRLTELPDGVEVFSRDLRLEWMPGGLEDVEAGTEWLVGLADDWRPDIVHLNQFSYAVGAFRAPVMVVAHSDVLSWFEEVRGHRAPTEWEPYRAAVRAGMAAADLIVAPTAYQSGWLARQYGRSAVRVIHNGMALPAHAPTLPPPSKRSLVLVAGRAWDEAKGISLLDRAVGSLGEAAPSVHLVGPLRGPGGEVTEVEHLVAHGEVDAAEMSRFYGNTRLYVGPSLYEPFGLSPLEAAAHGCGLLLSGIGSFRELWTGAADFFDPLVPAVLAGRLQAALEDAGELDRRAALGASRARERYTVGRMTDQYESLYRQLEASAPGPSTVMGRPLNRAP